MSQPPSGTQPVQPFCRAREGNRQTTVLVTASIAIVRILTIAAMRPNNNNNSQDDVSGASITASHCESLTSLFDKGRLQRPLVSGPQTKCTILGCESPGKLLPSAFTIAIDTYHYSAQKLILILPSH